MARSVLEKENKVLEVPNFLKLKKFKPQKTSVEDEIRLILHYNRNPKMLRVF